jgi:hypothetical protein
MPEEKPLPNLLVIHGAFALNPEMRHRGSLELKDDTPGGDMLIPGGSGPHEGRRTEGLKPAVGVCDILHNTHRFGVL